MSLDRARRRFAVAAIGDVPVGMDHRLKLRPVPRGLRAALTGCAEAVLFIAALIGGTMGLVRVLDLLLDQLHDWLC